MSHNAQQSKVSASRLQRGASGERKTTEALARLHSARSFNHSHCFTAEGWGSSIAPLGRLSSAEPYYGGPTCPECGSKDLADVTEMEYEEWAPYNDYKCKVCDNLFSSEEAYPDEPLGYALNDVEYAASSDAYGDIFITKSPYFTYAQFCSPCAPGAVYIINSVEDGAREYCFGHDWFDGGKAPYRVFRVDNGEEVFPNGQES